MTEKPEGSAKPEETEKPGETEEPEVLPPNLPTEEVVLDNFGYAYIFGYEPEVYRDPGRGGKCEFKGEHSDGSQR